MLNLLFVAIGVLQLTSGGEALIRGSLAAANRLGISPLLSGSQVLLKGAVGIAGSKEDCSCWATVSM